MHDVDLVCERKGADKVGVRSFAGAVAPSYSRVRQRHRGGPVDGVGGRAGRADSRVNYGANCGGSVFPCILWCSVECVCRQTQGL